MKIESFLVLLFCISLCTGCKVEPRPIDYGNDQCVACKMMISDKRFGAQLVSTKGKINNYDAIECMLEDIHKNGADKYAHFMVTHFYDPGVLVDARNSKYLISKERPSPMGAFLSAYDTSSEELKGDIYNWNGILEIFKN